MKKIKTLGIVTTVFLIIIIAALAVLAALGIFENEKEPSLPGDIEINSGEPDQWQLSAAGGDITAKITTDKGEMTFRLLDCQAAEKFIELGNAGVFEGAAFKTLAEDMFIQTDIRGEGFMTEKTELSAISGAIGFAAEKGEAFPGIVIITGSDLTEELGDSVIVFGQLASGAETLSAIASGENSGYTGGFAAAEPVSITNIEIIYPAG